MLVVMMVDRQCSFSSYPKRSLM